MSSLGHHGFALWAWVFVLVIIIHPIATSSSNCRPGETHEYVRGLVDRKEVAGAVYIVASGNRTLDQDAFGLRDVDRKLPMQMDTICWSASIYKVIAVATVMTLVDDQLLTLEDTVEQHLPQFADQSGPDGRHHPITIRQLMSHSSGLVGVNSKQPRRSWPVEAVFERSYLQTDLNEYVASAAQQSLQFRPGSDVRYSNLNIEVLSMVAESVSGQTWHELVRKRIFEPTGMTDASFWPWKERNRVSRMYTRPRANPPFDGRFEARPQVPYENVPAIRLELASSILFLTAADYIRFLQIFIRNDGQVLSQAAVREMLSPQATGSDRTYGLGFHLQNESFQHGGSVGTFIFGHPAADPQIVAVLFTQTRARDRTSMDQMRLDFRNTVVAEFFADPTAAANE
jgi:CubicO group peptidase (beta-lactamase class C family)